MFEPLAPRSESTYRRLLERALIASKRLKPDIANWPASCKQTLRAALKWSGQADLATQIGKVRLHHKEPERPSAEEMDAFERLAAELPRGRRALLLLQLRLGLRAQGLLQLQRDAVKSALRSGKLVFLNKGGQERVLPVGQSVRGLLQDLLDAAPATGKGVWTHAGQILSAKGGQHTQYQLYRRLVVKVGRQAGLTRPHTHMARHAFATRMHAQGAPLSTIQAALIHESPATTAKYVHPELDEILKYQR